MILKKRHDNLKHYLFYLILHVKYSSVCKNMRYIKSKEAKKKRFDNDSLCLILYLIIYNRMLEDSYSLVLKVPAVADKNLKPIVPMTEASIYVGDGTIDMTMPDHTMRKYNMEGHLINDFYIASVRKLEYEKDEIVYRNNIVNKVDDEITEILEETYHPKATARLRAYVAGNEYEGLMTAEGHVVMMPLYKTLLPLTTTSISALQQTMTK